MTIAAAGGIPPKQTSARSGLSLYRSQIFLGRAYGILACLRPPNLPDDLT